jgi:hypothetical protein
MGEPGDRGGPARPVANTHLHLPPNFSAFRTVEDAVETGAREGVRVMGTSNFHDVRVNGPFEAAAQAAGIVPLFGLEAITLAEDLEADRIRVNDPVNPGRFYLCGKGLTGWREPGPEARRLLAAARAGNEARARELVWKMDACFATAGLVVGLAAEAIVDEVAGRAGVPADWVVLQERHVAMAFQEALFREVPVERRAAVLARAYGRPPAAHVEDASATQGEIRARLMKADGGAFVPETPVSFDDAYRLVLELGGIPCYPTVADGSSPVCEWEAPATALAERVRERQIHLAELIPIRNSPAVLDEYVAAFRAAGILVLAGTEHNTLDRLPIEPRCVGGAAISEVTLDTFWEATCVVAAHQHLRAAGRHGYVDREGRLDPGFPDEEARIRHYRDLGEDLLARPMEVSR